MKRSVAWHKERLKNWTAYIDRKEREAQELFDRVAKDRKDIETLVEQIKRAEKEGRDGFDAEKYKAK